MLSKAFILMLTAASLVVGQDVGVDLCACTPTTYEFTFDFSLTCPPIGIPGGSNGVEDVACVVSTSDETVTDLTPVVVQGVQIIELNLDNVPISQQSINIGGFDNGATFTYEALVSAAEGIDGALDVPTGLQFLMTALNANGDVIQNVFIIRFTGDCDALPVLTEGQTIGWVELTTLGELSERLCPAAFATNPPTSTPTSTPEASPTTTPPTSPESTPTTVPTGTSPTSEPIAVPTSFPSEGDDDDDGSRGKSKSPKSSAKSKSKKKKSIVI